MSRFERVENESILKPNKSNLNKMNVSESLM